MQSTFPNPPCAFSSCARVVAARGYCRAHYQQLREGRPLTVIKPRTRLAGSAAARLEARTDRTGDCWIWLGSRSRGYGYIAVDGKEYPAHRVAYELSNGPIPKGLVIDHICHTRACVRPAHLHAVTGKQNAENRRGARQGSVSGVRGVHWDRTAGSWRAVVTHHGVRYHAGRHDSLSDAEAAVIAKRNELFTNNLLDPKTDG